MNEERRREMALGRLEHKAHQRYPHYDVRLALERVGVAEKEVSGGMLRVFYRYSTWDYQLNGREVPRAEALEAMGRREASAAVEAAAKPRGERSVDGN